jgi:hypothetical protein
MMHLGLLRAAYFARLFLDLASLEINTSVAATNVLSTLFVCQRLAMGAHVSGVTGAAIVLRWAAISRRAAFGACRLLHPFTVTRTLFQVKHG